MVRLYSTIMILAMFLLTIGACSNSGSSIAPPTASDMSSDLGWRTAHAAGDIIIKAAWNTVKIKRGMDISGFKETITIRAARNENEPFQVIPLPKTGMGLSGVQVAVSDLTGPGGAVFSQDNFSYFLEGYVYCAVSSDKGGDTGWFPDPLIPIANPFNIDLLTGLQPVWVDARVPKGTTPGWYDGTVVVTADGGKMGSIPIRMKVMNFTLPDKPSLKTAFGVNREVINDYHGFAYGENSPEVEAVRDKYREILLDRRVSFWGFDMFKPAYTVNADNTVSVDFSEVLPVVQKYIEGGKYYMTTFQFPVRLWDLQYSRLASDCTVGSNTWRTRVKSYISECSKWMDSQGILDKSYIFILDEPNTYTDYVNVRYLGQMIHEIPQPRAKFMVTEQPYSWNYTSWGSLLGYVDIFCPIIYLVDPNLSYNLNDPYFDGGYEYDLWMYTNTNMYPRLGYAIDHPAVEPRLVAWHCYQRGIDAMLYWSVNYWKVSNPWVDPYTLGDRDAGAGCGSMTYPGMFISNYSDQPNVDGPISSIRLEQVREGIEDYEYMMYCAGGGNIAQLKSVIDGSNLFVTDGDEVYKFRNLGLEMLFGGG